MPHLRNNNNAQLLSVNRRVSGVELLPTKNPRLGFDGLKLRGGNIMVEKGVAAPYTETWQTFWGEFNWDGLIRPQIDAAINLGVNSIRIIGSLLDVLGTPAAMATYFARWDQVIDYCAERGIYVYVCGGEHSQRGAATVPQMATGLAALAAHVEGKWNVIGLDLLQEVNAWWQIEGLAEATVLTNLVTISTATQAAAPTLPQTYSRSVFNTGTAGTGINYTGLNTALGTLLDYVDMHVYYTPLSTDMDTFYAANTRPVIFGEFGIAISETSQDRTARFDAVRDLVLSANHGGALAWSVWDNFSGVDPTTKYGLYSDTAGTRRTDVTAVLDDFPSSFTENRSVQLLLDAFATKKSLTGTATAVADVIASVDATSYSSFSVQITGAAAGGTTVGVEISNDGVTWVATRLQNAQDATSILGSVSAAAVGALYRGPIVARFIRVRCTAYTGPGTVAASLLLSPDVFTSVVKST